MAALIEAVSEHFVAVVVGLCFLAAIVVRAVISIVSTTSRERSRREIAAYIAEGSLSPEQGERLLKAEVDRSGRIS